MQGSAYAWTGGGAGRCGPRSKKSFQADLRRTSAGLLETTPTSFPEMTITE